MYWSKIFAEIYTKKLRGKLKGIRLKYTKK